VNEKAISERIDALDRLFTSQLGAQDEKVQLALTAADKALMKAEAATEKRFEGVNEFRATLSDQAATFVTREFLDGALLSMSVRMDSLERAVSRTLLALLVSIVTALVAALVVVATR
jgi:hypothetical protein